MAREAEQTMMDDYDDRPAAPPIESALLAFAKLVLEREPTAKMVDRAWDCTTKHEIYRAMTSELLRELEEGK